MVASQSTRPLQQLLSALGGGISLLDLGWASLTHCCLKSASSGVLCGVFLHDTWLRSLVKSRWGTDEELLSWMILSLSSFNQFYSVHVSSGTIIHTSECHYAASWGTWFHTWWLLHLDRSGKSCPNSSSEAIDCTGVLCVHPHVNSTFC
jgi:hypothetical protein